MKKMFQFVCVVLVTACLAFGLVACGGDSPKSLAQQSFDAMKSGNNAKMQEINKKVAALSPEDQKVFGEELNRLATEAQ